MSNVIDAATNVMQTLGMRHPSADDTELLDLIDRHVSPERRYMRLLHGNFAMGPDRAEFLRALVEDAERITDHELGVLLDADWRARITAAWMIGASRRSRFHQRLGALTAAGRPVVTVEQA